MTLQLFKKPLGQFRRFQEQAALARPFREILGLKENGSVCLPAFSPLGCSRRVGQDHGACGGRPVAETDVCLRRRRRGARALEGRWCARARFNRDPLDKQGVVSAARSFGVCYAAGRRVDIVLVRAKRMSLAPRCACRNVCPRRQPGAPAGDIRCLIQSY
jgi:hypothetical protein